MVIETGKPNFRAASCCNVEVVKGGAGDFLAGLWFFNSGTADYILELGHLSFSASNFGHETKI